MLRFCLIALAQPLSHLHTPQQHGTACNLSLFHLLDFSRY